MIHKDHRMSSKELIVRNSRHEQDPRPFIPIKDDKETQFVYPKAFNDVIRQLSNFDDYLIEWHNKPFSNWLSVKKKESCYFSRRNGHTGKIILGYSIRLRLFKRDII